MNRDRGHREALPRHVQAHVALAQSDPEPQALRPSLRQSPSR